MVGWTIASLKTSARAALDRNYWPCVAAGLISLAIGFAGGGGGRPRTSLGETLKNGIEVVHDLSMPDLPSDDAGVDGLAAAALSEAADGLSGVDPEISGAVSLAASRFEVPDASGSRPRTRPAWFYVAAAAGCMFAVNLFFSFALLVQFFAIGPLEVGLSRFFLRSSRDKSLWADLGWGFDKRRYWTVARTMWVASAAERLWYLVFFVPGVVKSYSWRLVPMILADDGPVERSSFALMRRSRDLTDGHKLHMLGLDLSFAGWWLLSLLLCFVPAVFFVVPWKSLTDAGLYDTLRSGES